MPRPLVLGHRGASAIAPENTIASFLFARQLGADGIELDVMLSRDRVPVAIHDNRVDRTTDGNGYVRTMTVLELKHLDAGSYKSPQYRGETIPTLAEVLDSLQDWLTPTDSRFTTPVIVNIELKSNAVASDGLEVQVLNVIAQKNVESHVLISSFNPLALWRTKALDPRLARGLLYSADLPVYLRRAWLRLLAAPQAMHPEHTMIDSRLVRWAKGKRLAVNTWTVDDATEAARLASLGIDAIITNKPDVIRKAVDDGSNPHLVT